jgi:hypothetical protein
VKRFWPFVLSVILFVAPSAHAAGGDFARAELDRYLKQLSAGGRLAPQVNVAVDPALGDEAFSISTEGDRIKVVGSNDLMVLTGAYHLLDLLGCRFLAPNFAHYQGSAELVPIGAGLRVKLDAPILRKPTLKFRKLYVEEGISHDIDSLKQLVEWMPRAGYNTLVIPTDYAGRGRVKWDHWREALTPELQKRGLTIEVGGHGYENFLNAGMESGKLFARRPEWFGANAAGERQKPTRVVFCTSNAEARETVIRNVLAYLKARPEIQIFDFWPPDGAKWCECDDCKKLGEPPDRQAILLKQVQDAVRSIRPDVRLEVIAYSSYLNPPKDVPIDKNVLVDFCPISQHFDEQIDDADSKNKVYADALRAWRKDFAGDISIYSYYRKYAWDSLPVVIPHYMQKDLQWYATLPVQGISVYSEPADWFTYELNHYVLAKLAWDPNVDVDALVTKFCQARYGSEWKIARDALVTLQDAVRNYGSVPHVPLKSPDAIAKARDGVKARLMQVDMATSRSANLAEKRNLGRLKLMITYAERDLEIQHLRATNAMPEQIREKATDLHAWVKSHADDGVFLIKGNRLNLNRMHTRYGVGQARREATAVPE